MKEKQKRQEEIDKLFVRSQNVLGTYSDKEVKGFIAAAEALKKEPEKVELSEAQMVIGKGQLLVDRPSGMNFAVYRYMRAYQNKVLKQLFPSPADPQIARLMRPRIDSIHLQNQVLEAREKRRGNRVIESFKNNWLGKLINGLRSKFYATQLRSREALA